MSRPPCSSCSPSPELRTCSCTSPAPDATRVASIRPPEVGLDGPLRGRHPACMGTTSSRYETAQGAPIVDDSPPRRHRRLAIIAAGTLTGLVVGGLVVLLVGAPRATGSGDNPAVWVFGLPGFLAIAGTVIGWVAAGLPSVEV